MSQTVTAEVEIETTEGTRSIQMLLQPGAKISECKTGKVVMLNLSDGQTPTGVFKGMSGDDVKLGALRSDLTLGYNIQWVDTYFEELNKKTTASELKPGDRFKMGKQRNWRTVSSSLLLGPPQPHAGMFLIVLDGCRQMILHPDTEVADFKPGTGN
jgi:hypothetical protein